MSTESIEYFDENGASGYAPSEATSPDDVLDEYARLREEGVPAQPNLERRLKERERERRAAEERTHDDDEDSRNNRTEGPPDHAGK
jgi:hypothetical protein